MVPAGTRRAGGLLRLALLPFRASWVGRAGLPCLVAGLLAGVSCVSWGGGPDAPPGAPVPLTPEEGTTVTGRLRPGETVSYTVPLEEGEYLELHLDRGQDDLTGYLYGPGVEPTGSTTGASSWTELAPDVEGQVLWELAQASGDHLLLLQPKSEWPLPYEFEVAALRSANNQDRARHECDESFAEALTLSKAGSLNEALTSFDKTLDLCRKGNYARGLGSTLYSRANALIKLSRFEDAREDLEAALQVWTELRETRSMAGVKVRLATVERRLAHWDLAERLLEEGLRLARKVGARKVEANALDNYCRIYLEKGHTEQALSSCREAIALWESLNEPAEMVESLNNLGYLYRTQGDLDIARKHYLECMRILSEQPDPEKRPNVRNNLALIYEAEGEYQKALAEYQAAAEGLRRVGRLSEAGVAVQNSGRIHHYRLRNFDTALDYYEQALALMERARDPLGKIPVLQSLGDLHQERGNLVQARSVLEEALELSRQADARPYLVGSLVRMGWLLLEEQDAGDVRAHFQEALVLNRQISNRWAESDALEGLGESLAHRGEEERALEHLFEAAAVSEEIGDRTGAAESRYRIARIERDRGNLQAARQAVEQVLGVVDEIRTVVGSTELRTLFSATARPYHELYIDVLMAQHERRPDAGHDVEALRASEEARAQGLLEILAEAELDPGREVPQELLDRRAEMLRQLNAKELERQELLADEEANRTALLRVKLDLQRLLTRLRELEREIRAASPRYAALTHPRPVSVGEIQRTILDGETALLEYSLGEERSFLWVVTDDRLRTYELPGRAEIDSDARCLHWLITAFGEPPSPDALTTQEAACLGQRLDRYRELPAGGHPLRVLAHRRRVLEAAFDEVAVGLSEVLLGSPTRDGLLPFRLAIVSDGALEYVPFSVLPSPEEGDQPLVKGHEMIRQPSASVLAFQREQPPPATTPTGELAIVADPVYSPDDARIAGGIGAGAEGTRGVSDPAAPVPRRRYTRLTYSKEEARRIARFAPEDRTFLALGSDASRETVLRGTLSGYRYLHFATHGRINTRFPELSGLVLSQVDDDGRWRENAHLRLNDIYGLELDATDMVVLSACETALGREVRGEGLVGLTRGFLYAGAERVVASLWQVQDRATADLMEHLYHGLLQEGRSPAEALRHAQLATLEEPGGRYEFPYYWAGFVLQGEWR